MKGHKNLTRQGSGRIIRAADRSVPQFQNKTDLELPMLSFIQKYKLNRAVESYINELGSALVKRYGACDQYTVMQVEKTARSLNLGMQYISYAIALYRKDESVNTIDLYRIDQGFLDILR